MSPFELLSALPVSEELSRSLVDSREVLLSALDPLGAEVDDEGRVISSFSPHPVRSTKEKSRTAARRIETIFFIKVAPLPVFSEIGCSKVFSGARRPRSFFDRSRNYYFRTVKDYSPRREKMNSFEKLFSFSKSILSMYSLSSLS